MNAGTQLYNAGVPTGSLITRPNACPYIVGREISWSLDITIILDVQQARDVSFSSFFLTVNLSKTKKAIWTLAQHNSVLFYLIQVGTYQIEKDSNKSEWTRLRSPKFKFHLLRLASHMILNL